MSTWLDGQDPERIERALAGMRTDLRTRVYIEQAAHGDERFALWLLMVDRRLRRAIGLGHRDLVDWTWRDAYDAGMSPASAALQGLQNDEIGAAWLADVEGEEG